jgi:hypothetical protein
VPVREPEREKVKGEPGDALKVSKKRYFKRSFISNEADGFSLIGIEN